MKEEIRNEIIKHINSFLDIRKWTFDERIDGKRVDLPNYWEKEMHEIIWEYKHKGWKVFWFEEEKKNYLEFSYPRGKK